MLKKTNPSFIPCIGLDLLGSDADSNSILESAIPILENLKHRANFILFGEEKNRKPLSSISFISYQIAPETITMNDDPLSAIHKKKNASLLLGIRSLKQKQIHAFISMGNTGALLTASITELKRLPCIKRPALLALLPTRNKEMVVLDVGANTEFNSSHLLGFAAMGVAYQKTRGVLQPTIGLLNIGKEESKGTPELKKAYKLLDNLNASHDYKIFQGNVEGNSTFQGEVDILVTDGFTGNVFLKTSEGIAHLVLNELKKTDTMDLITLKNKFNSNEYPGATLCGINGIVIKCHGSAHPRALYHSLLNALDLIEQNFLENIDKEISSFFSPSC